MRCSPGPPSPPGFSTHSKIGSNVIARKKIIQPFLGRGLDLKKVKSKNIRERLTHGLFFQHVKMGHK
jgi:hypothetical protein